MPTIYQLLSANPSVREKVCALQFAPPSARKRPENPSAMDTSAKSTPAVAHAATMKAVAAAPVIRETALTELLPPCVEAYETKAPSVQQSKSRKHKAGRMVTASPLPAVVIEARRFTKGKRLFMIGGDLKKQDLDRIELALQCKVRWHAAKRGENMDRIKAVCAQHDLLVFVVWLASHGHSDSVTSASREFGIPLVRILRGTNPVAIAQEICHQVGQTAGR